MRNRKNHWAFIFTLLMLFPCAAFAQENLQDKMSPEEFKAAGLEKLTAEELSVLNNWLQGKVTEESKKAATQARKEVEDTNRGFFNFGSSEPVVSRLAGEFTGFSKGQKYTLENGQLWRQTDAARLDGVRKSNPVMTIRPGVIGNVWYMTVDGYNTRARVERIK